MEHITILIPAYNTIRYISDCLKSCIAQNYGNYDILIVDDGSTDGTKELVEQYVANYPVSILSLPKNRGVTNATAVGIKAAQGPLITILDSDDIIYSQSLAIGAQPFTDPEVGFVWTRFTKSTSGKLGWSKKPPPGVSLYTALMHKDWWCATHQKFFRKSVYTKGIPLNVTIDRSSDFQLVLLLASSGCKCIHVAQVTYWYRMQRKGSITSEGSHKQKQAVVDIRKYVNRQMKKRGLNEPR